MDVCVCGPLCMQLMHTEGLIMNTLKWARLQVFLFFSLLVQFLYLNSPFSWQTEGKTNEILKASLSAWQRRIISRTNDTRTLQDGPNWMSACLKYEAWHQSRPRKPDQNAAATSAFWWTPSFRLSANHQKLCKLGSQAVKSVARWGSAHFICCVVEVEGEGGERAMALGLKGPLRDEKILHTCFKLFKLSPSLSRDTHTHTHAWEYTCTLRCNTLRSGTGKFFLLLSALMCIKQKGACLHEFIYKAT